jgi:4-hydroxy-tetrahydrodipicolinate reductase
MKVALLGYGKMGKEIESVALSRGHEIVLRLNSSDKNFSSSDLQGADVAIEFSRPDSAMKNIRTCFEADIPVIVGTTGWYENFTELAEQCNNENKSMLCATNFSVGVNIFFELNKFLARMMDAQKEYEAEVEEIHHTQKLDAPSGTAITIAEGMLMNLQRKTNWVSGEPASKEDLNIISQRIDNIPGTHIVRYSSEIDEIEIRHTAHNRKGFATGAVIAAEWIIGKKGIFSMKDVLGFN